MSEHKITIVMATHKRANILPQTIQSILDQAPPNFEFVIVDDASTDNTMEVLQAFRQETPCIHVIHLAKNSGPGAARNAGLAAATGDYIAIMDDDDVPHPQRIPIQRDYLDRNPEVDLLLTPVRWVNNDGEGTNIFPGIAQRGEFPPDPGDLFRLLYLESNKIPNTTIMFRRHLLKQFSGYPEEPWIGEDWYWFMQMAASGIRFASLREPLVNTRRDRANNNLMQNKRKAFQAQRLVLRMIQCWLQEQEIHQFDHLHKKALSNQLVREARFWGGAKGIMLCLHALLLNPNHKKARQTILEIIGRGRKKIAGLPE